jgi:hypothetical protein
MSATSRRNGSVSVSRKQRLTTPLEMAAREVLAGQYSSNITRPVNNSTFNPNIFKKNAAMVTYLCPIPQIPTAPIKAVPTFGAKQKRY